MRKNHMLSRIVCVYTDKQLMPLRGLVPSGYTITEWVPVHCGTKREGGGRIRANPQKLKRRRPVLHSPLSELLSVGRSEDIHWL